MPPVNECAPALTLVPDGEAGGRARGVCRQLDEEVPGHAEETLVGEVLHLVGIIKGSCVDAVTVLDQQPGGRIQNLTEAALIINIENSFYP